MEGAKILPIKGLIDSSLKKKKVLSLETKKQITKVFAPKGNQLSLLSHRLAHLILIKIYEKLLGP